MKVIRSIITTVLILLAIFLCFYNLGKHKIQRWDEQTNIDVVDETLSGGDSIILTYNNSPFFEKPPLWYWINIGVSRFASTNSLHPYRLISAISGVGIVTTIYLIGKDFWGYWGGVFSGFTILATQHLFVNNVAGYFSTHTFRSADLDALQILFILISLYFFWKAEKENNKKVSRHLLLGGTFSAFAVLTKGPFGTLPIFLWLIFRLINFIKSQEKIYLKFCKDLGIAILSFLIIALPWHIFMYFKFGQPFIDEFFIYHAVRRVTETLEAHHEPWNFYIYLLFHPQVFAPAVLLPVSIILMLKKTNIFKDFRVYISITGILLLLIFLTLIQTKLAWYTLYIYPFAALLIGYLFAQILKLRNNKFRIFATILVWTPIIFGIIYNISWVLSI